MSSCLFDPALRLSANLNNGEGVQEVFNGPKDSNAESSLRKTTLASCSRYIFSRIPEELNFIILCLLGNDDFLNLRLSSRAIASISHPLQLPQAFWASRFAPGMEMDFMFKGYDSIPTHHWRNVYANFKLALRESEFRGNLQNRRRICRNLSHISHSLTLLVDQPGSLPSLSERRGLDPNSVPDGHQPGSFVRATAFDQEGGTKIDNGPLPF
jgi:hypothetical protein